MFQVYLTNMGYAKPEMYGSFARAIEAAKATGFECTIIRPGYGVAGWWSPLSGTRRNGEDEPRTVNLMDALQRSL